MGSFSLVTSLPNKEGRCPKVNNHVKQHYWDQVAKTHLRLLECHRTKIIIGLRPEREKSKIQPKRGWTEASLKKCHSAPLENTQLTFGTKVI